MATNATTRLVRCVIASGSTQVQTQESLVDLGSFGSTRPVVAQSLQAVTPLDLRPLRSLSSRLEYSFVPEGRHVLP